jgi:WD40 repeat protein
MAVQEINNAHSDSIWVVCFSPCGTLMATAGKDAIIKVWQAASHSFEDPDELLLFLPEPVWELKEHAHDILDLSWHQKSELLLSTSFD